MSSDNVCTRQLRYAVVFLSVYALWRRGNIIKYRKKIHTHVIQHVFTKLTFPFKFIVYLSEVTVSTLLCK